MTLTGHYAPGNPAETKEKAEQPALSVHQALRAKLGICSVEGMLVSLSPVFKMISREIWLCANCNWESRVERTDMPVATGSRPLKCVKCGEKQFQECHEYVNALHVELKDQVPINELESLRATLFDKDAEHPRPGEIVRISGNLYVEDVRGKLATFFKAESVQYQSRSESIVTDADIIAFERFAKMPHLRERLISMTALPVIGHDNVKIGLLRALASTSESGYQKERVHTALVGDRGTAKSILAREASKMIPSSRYVTAQTASGKSLTAIVDKSSESTTLRLGPIPLAKGSICVINEAGLMDPLDQGLLLDVLEEGSFVLSKHGITAQIDSPTTIILTANQHNAEWRNTNSIADDEIPILKTSLDRIAQLYVFRDSVDLEAAKFYALKKSEVDRKAHRFNYRFIRKYLQHCRTIKPALTPEAEAMLNEFWIAMKITGRAGPRALEALKRMARAQARLYLKDSVTSEIAKEVMEDYTKILADYGRMIAATQDPREITYRTCLEILKDSNWPIAFEELAKVACEKNEQVLHYLIGEMKIEKKNAYKLRNNRKLRSVLELLLNHSGIVEIHQKPVILKWMEKKE